jgi:hypothetical protein
MISAVELKRGDDYVKVRLIYAGEKVVTFEDGLDLDVVEVETVVENIGIFYPEHEVEVPERYKAEPKSSEPLTRGEAGHFSPPLELGDEYSITNHGSSFCYRVMKMLTRHFCEVKGQDDGGEWTIDVPYRIDRSTGYARV